MSSVHSNPSSAATHQRPVVSLLAPVLVIVLGLALGVGVRGFHHRELADARTMFRMDRHEKSARVVEQFHVTFREMYLGLRTIARLPGVRSIDRHAAALDADARQTAQEIYNNLASNVAMSEVYIVPLDMRPDEVDPTTGKLQGPLVTFDELIVGRTLASAGERLEAKKAEEFEETEIHEYRVMRQQLDWLAANYPNEASIRGLEYPALCGPEVLTCDNSLFSPSRPDDRDRSGLVYSVPFYGPDGTLRGCVSGVILTQRLGDMLPSGDFAIRNTPMGYTVTAATPGVADSSAVPVREHVPDPTLPYSEVLRLPVNDLQGDWMLWCGASDASFLHSEAYISARRAMLMGSAGCAVVFACVLVVCYLGRQAYLEASSHAALLETRISMRTADLRAALNAAQEATRAKSAFLANMSHEIRTPMSAIVGYTDLLLDPDQTPEQRASSIQTIRRNGRHLLTIVSDILDLSKVDAGAMTVESIETDPVQLTEEICSLLNVRARERGIALRLRVDSPVPHRILSDPGRIRQILTNLIGNAIKFTEVGEVWVILRVPADAPTTLRFEVQDTGIGLTPAQIEGLFRPFTQADDSMTRRFGGTGLGLTISKRLALLLGGDVSVESTPGKGSVFTFTLELGTTWLSQQPSGSRSQSVDAGPLPSLGGLRVLLTEDGEDNQRLIAHLLRKSGASVDIAENGQEGSGKALDALGRAQPYHVILMDMQMPVMDGYTAARTLRKSGYTAPIIALTAHALPEDRQKCLEAGCDDFLTKPIDRAKLISTCHRWASASERRAA